MVGGGRDAAFADLAHERGQFWWVEQGVADDRTAMLRLTRVTTSARRGSPKLLPNSHRRGTLEYRPVAGARRASRVSFGTNPLRGWVIRVWRREALRRSNRDVALLLLRVIAVPLLTSVMFRGGP